MTEEELKAKSNAILDKLEEDGFDLGDWSIEDAHNNGFIDGYHECQKEHEWHDLRKNPEDLPLTEREVMVFIEWKNTENETEYAYDLGTRHFNGNWCLDVFSSEDKDTKVVAWYNFPQFKQNNLKHTSP